ncbi:hypothetical protein C8J28_1131 [Cereibacter azotoformans]|uniref:Uncharacterized protein n=1 Tax=Cereibacter azotoformans TaxID=43057 RepID=A0A2T5K0B0_9RHOB|nr:hypothetical protein C8J28_1131 [Cereibacter azotoformans]
MACLARRKGRPSFPLFRPDAWAWQMPAGGGWGLPILGLVTVGLGILHSARGAEAAHPAPTPAIADS